MEEFPLVILDGEPKAVFPWTVAKPTSGSQNPEDESWPSGWQLCRNHSLSYRVRKSEEENVANASVWNLKNGGQVQAFLCISFLDVSALSW